MQDKFFSDLSDIMDLSEYCDFHYATHSEAVPSPYCEKLALHSTPDAPDCENIVSCPIPPVTGAPVNVAGTTGLNGFLRSQLGRRISVEFVLGTNVVEKTGYLVGVGKNYIVLYYPASKDYAVCDFFSIKFITVFHETTQEEDSFV